MCAAGADREETPGGRKLRTSAGGATTQAPVATTATTADRHSQRPQPPDVVQTFPANPLIDNGRGIENTPNPRRRVRVIA